MCGGRKAWRSWFSPHGTIAPSVVLATLWLAPEGILANDAVGAPYGNATFHQATSWPGVAEPAVTVWRTPQNITGKRTKLRRAGNVRRKVRRSWKIPFTVSAGRMSGKGNEGKMKGEV